MGEREPIPVYHTHGAAACGGVAFLWVGPRPMYHGDTVHHQYVCWPGGGAPGPWSAARCAACGLPLSETAFNRMAHHAGIFEDTR
jgi:hypothetical protein